MKYEIMKGSAKDFEGAPDWAVNVQSVTASVGYLRAFCGGGKYQYIDGCSGAEPAGKIKHGCFSDLPWSCNPTIIAERRPITDPVWDGEGLPPVGVECEGLFPRHPGNSFEWQDCLVLYVFEHECAVKSKGTSNLHYCDQFRPIRSPEDVARDEGKEVIAKSLRSSKDYDEAAGVIYDAIAAGRIKGLIKEPSTADLKINITTDEMWREFEKKSDMEDVRKLMMDSLAEQRVAFNKSRHSSF